MSTKQIQYAVVQGRKVTFHPGYGLAPVVGYVVAMDDFHWLVAAPTSTKGEIMTTLVHKRSPVVIISNQTDLDHEDVADKVAIEELGRLFFVHCERSLNRKQP